MAQLAVRGDYPAFFSAMARLVARVFGVRGVLIARWSERPATHARTLAMWVDQHSHAGFRYPLAEAPCGRVVKGRIWHCREGVRRCYPKAPWLESTGAEGYLGLPLRNTHRATLGVLALLAEGPLEVSVEDLRLLEMVAGRLGSEVEGSLAVDAVRRNEERFRQLAEQARDVLWVVELPSRRLAYLSPSAETFTRIPFTESGRSAHRALRIIHPLDRRRVFQQVTQALSQGATDYSIEYRVLGPDGAVRWFADRGVIVRDSEGRPTRLSGVARDITTRKRSEESLAAGAHQLRLANAALLELARSHHVSQGHLAEALREIAEAAARGVGVARVTIWFMEDDAALRCVGHFEPGVTQSQVGMELRLKEFASYHEAVVRERFVSVSDAAVDARTRDLHDRLLGNAGVSSVLHAGIRLRGHLVGVICLDHAGPVRAWRNEEELFTGSLADVIALVMQTGERRCMEEALRQSEEAYRSVVAALAEGVMLVHRDGSFGTFNDSAAQILGVTPQFLREHRLFDEAWECFRMDGSPLRQADFPGAITLRSGAPVHDFVMGVRRPAGDVAWLSVNCRPFGRDDTGRVASVVISFADITRRRQAEQALREGLDLLQAVSDLQAGFIAQADGDATFQHMLGLTLRMTGSAWGWIGEVLPSPDAGREIRLHPPRQVSTTLVGLPTDDRVIVFLRDVMGSGHSKVSTLVGDDPGSRVLHWLGLPLRHDEEVVGVIVLLRSEPPHPPEFERRLEPLLITCANLIRAVRIDRQREEAEARIRQLNADLERRVEERTSDLRATNEELAQLAYVVTHDLKAPLRGIHQLSEWLTQDHTSQLNAEGLRLLGLLRGRVKHLQRMIDGLLACARVGRTPEPELRVPVGDLVREVAGVLEPPPHILIRTTAELPTVWGNPDRLNQIFQNLLDNAVKYLEKPSGWVEVSAFRRRGQWEFRVADNGPGIPLRYHDKVFQIFQRLDPPGHIPGTGLGLTLVKRIVENRGGRIWIESVEDAGTTICFTWPDRPRERAV
jgi:PAS domain S-box-containing protein